jgi:Tfp pilus assembly protein PilO
MHGNPFLRLLRREVEELVRKKHGDRGLKERQRKVELGRVNLEMKRLRAQLASLEERKSKLMADLGT